MATNQLVLNITGMHCGSCEQKIATALRDVEGVGKVTVSRAAGRAEVEAEDSVSHDSLTEAVASAGDYSASVLETEVGPGASAGEAGGDGGEKESLYPLFLIVGYILGGTILVAAAAEQWAVEPMMRHFMAGFFLVFSFFKLLDLPGFVSAYRGYDLLARRVGAWGWVYPFVELGLGVAYLLALAPVVVNAVTLVLMLVGAAGVLRALLDKRAIRCACLGTALNLPMTTVTLVEDLAMAAMAGAMLLLML